MDASRAPETKAEILAWYKRAMTRLELRRSGRLRGWDGFLGKQDYDGYVESVERLFKEKKRGFNARLRDGKGT